MSSITIYLHVGNTHSDLFGALPPDDTTRDWPAFNLVITSPQGASRQGDISEQALNEIRGANLTSVKRLFISMEEEDWTDRFRAELDLCIPPSILCTEFRLVQPSSYEKGLIYFRGDPLVGQPTYSSLAVTLDSLFDANGNHNKNTCGTIRNMYNLHYLRFCPSPGSEFATVRLMDALALIISRLDSSVNVTLPHNFLRSAEDREEFDLLLRERK